jgi:ribose/xylose/arabinose/galactoside ABC-type transport system permease subunit
MNQRKMKRLFSSPVFGVYIGLILLFIIATIAAPDLFFSLKNFTNVLRQVSIVGVVSIGMTIVLLIGGIDLSVTSVMAVSACVMADFSQRLTKAGNPDLSFLIVLMIIGISLVIGFLNGAMIVFRGVEPFIITLGMNQLVYGLNLIYTHGSPVGGITQGWKDFGMGSLFNVVPWPVVLFAVLMVVAVIILRKTVFGRYIYAIGSNAEAARLSGIKVNRHKITAYMLCALTAAIAGIMMAARVGVGEPNGSKGYDLDAIAAVVIGGTSMAGGYGSLAGTLAGVLIMGIMNNMLNLINADPFLQIAIKGLIVIFAVLIQRNKKN